MIEHNFKMIYDIYPPMTPIRFKYMNSILTTEIFEIWRPWQNNLQLYATCLIFEIVLLLQQSVWFYYLLQ